MKKVYLVCGKTSAESYVYWILGVFSSRKKAEWDKKQLDELSKDCYHYIIEEPVH